MSVSEGGATVPRVSDNPVTRSFLQTFEEARERIFGRLAGLTDAEYLWEPVPSGLTVRAAGDGTFRADPRPDDVTPAPFSTIAWRMWHIGADCLRGYGRYFGDARMTGDERQVWPGTAAGSIEAMARDWAAFRAHVASLGDDRLIEPMGPIADPFADDTYLMLAIHALDEAAHHGAEIAVLRDLYLHGLAPA
jgi:hypothetical protein